MSVAHFGFMVSQVAHIEPTAYQVQYPDIQYHSLVPVDTSAHEWARTITHYSTDKVGGMQSLAGRANDVPMVDVLRSKFDVTVEMSAIGYDYTIEEISQAMMVPNLNLTADKAIAARRAAEEYLDDIVLYGDSDKGWDSLIKAGSTKVTAVDAADGAKGAGAAKKLWSNKTAEEIIFDINRALEAIYTSTTTVEMADTIGLPLGVWSDMLGKTISGTAVTVAEFIRQNNIYTMKTGNPLMIREIRGLENAAASSKGRMIAYPRNPQVLKFHLPMPFRFGTPMMELFRCVVPGYLRCGGLEIRRPKALRYVDGITT